MSKPIEKRTGDMTIFEAKKHASELSRSQKDKKVYVVVHVETGWCGVSYQPEVADHETHHCFRNGSEIAMDWKTPTKEPKTVKKGSKKDPQSEKLNSTKLKAKAKKVMKTAKKGKSAKKVSAKNRPAVKGKRQTLTIKEVIKALRGGKVVFNARNGKRVNLKKVSKRANTSAEWDVVVTEKE